MKRKKAFTVTCNKCGKKQKSFRIEETGFYGLSLYVWSTCECGNEGVIG